MQTRVDSGGKKLQSLNGRHPTPLSGIQRRIMRALGFQPAGSKAQVIRIDEGRRMQYRMSLTTTFDEAC
jgi:hypothetical protein